MMITAEQWTAAHPEGTPVKCWPGTREPSDIPHVGTVRSIAWQVGGGSLIAKVTGRAGGIHIAHIECDAKCATCTEAWAAERRARAARDARRRGKLRERA